MKRVAFVIFAGTVAAAAPAAAQQGPSRAALEQRYQIGQMERVLEGAVEHGLTITRDRVQALAQVPADLLVSENAHARGFRLDGYGVFFDVVVPSFETTLTWSLRTLDQNDLGLDSALRIAELVRDVNAQRQADLVRIDRTLGLVQNNVGIEVMKTRQQMNQMDLIYRASQRQ